MVNKLLCDESKQPSTEININEPLTEIKNSDSI